MENTQKILEKTSSIKHSKTYSEFLTHLDSIEKVEDKLRHTLDFMKLALMKDKTPVFRDFWEAKTLCLTYFKDTLTPRIRSLYWNEYVELSDEMRRIKESLDQESSYAEEQITLALQSVEKGMENLSSENADLPERGALYRKIQGELTLLNTYAVRVNTLRKELISTQLRMRTKNALFDRLVKVGDQIFPRKKELIQELSQKFTADVESFIQKNKKLSGPFFALKEEIKTLQTLAKALSVSPATFNETRLALSGLWDQIREKEQLDKETRVAQTGIQKENFEKIGVQVKAFQEECPKLSLKEADQKVETLLKEIKELDLDKEMVRSLKKDLFDAKKPLEDKKAHEDKERKESEIQNQKRYEETKIALSQQMREVLLQAEGFALEPLVEKWTGFVKEEKALGLEGFDKILFENCLATIVDHIQEKKWKAHLEEDSEELLQNLQGILDERRKERRKIKETLEKHRKTVGGSSLNMEQSMLYQELITEEKNRLDSIEIMIEELEEKIFDLEG